jgi:hypothetical protein
MSWAEPAPWQLTGPEAFVYVCWLLLLQVLLGGLGDQVHIAVRVCDAIGRLAEGFTGYAGE